VEADVLEALAVALANPGPRDPSVHAAMCGGVCGSTAASSLIGALATGAGQHTGAREVFRAMQGWEGCGLERNDWSRWMDEQRQPPGRIFTWPETRHVPGFDPNGASTPGVVRQLMESLLALDGAGPKLGWLAEQLSWFESEARGPLAISGVAAAVLSDLGFNAEQGEMLYLLLRLPGAAAHALEQGRYGHKRFPFYELELLNDPGPRGPGKAEVGQ
jgi:citrate synthase